MPDRDIALARAAGYATQWLDSLATRPVPPRASVAEVTAALGTALPDGPAEAPQVIDLLARACEPGLTAMPSGRFYGFVIGGTHPAALAADWLVSAWDQNAGLLLPTPALAAVENVAKGWLLDVLGLPAGSGVGFVTGATMSNFTCLAAARDAVLHKAGWDVAADGLTGAPRVRVLVGAERHDTVDLALRYLGLGAPEVVAADDQGRIDPVHSKRRWPPGRGPRQARRSWSCKRATSIPARSTPSVPRSRPRTGTAPGCISTARSACSRRRPRGPGTSSPATRQPIRGPPTRTRP